MSASLSSCSYSNASSAHEIYLGNQFMIERRCAESGDQNDAEVSREYLLGMMQQHHAGVEGGGGDGESKGNNNNSNERCSNWATTAATAITPKTQNRQVVTRGLSASAAPNHHPFTRRLSASAAVPLEIKTEQQHSKQSKFMRRLSASAVGPSTAAATLAPLEGGVVKPKTEHSRFMRRLSASAAVRVAPLEETQGVAAATKAENSPPAPSAQRKFMRRLSASAAMGTSQQLQQQQQQQLMEGTTTKAQQAKPKFTRRLSASAAMGTSQQQQQPVQEATKAPSPVHSKFTRRLSASAAISHHNESGSAMTTSSHSKFTRRLSASAATPSCHGSNLLGSSGKKNKNDPLQSLSIEEVAGIAAASYRGGESKLLTVQEAAVLAAAARQEKRSDERQQQQQEAGSQQQQEYPKRNLPLDRIPQGIAICDSSSLSSSGSQNAKGITSSTSPYMREQQPPYQGAPRFLNPAAAVGNNGPKHSFLRNHNNNNNNTMGSVASAGQHRGVPRNRSGYSAPGAYVPDFVHNMNGNGNSNNSPTKGSFRRLAPSRAFSNEKLRPINRLRSKSNLLYTRDESNKSLFNNSANSSINSPTTTTTTGNGPPSAQQPPMDSSGDGGSNNNNNNMSTAQAHLLRHARRIAVVSTSRNVEPSWSNRSLIVYDNATSLLQRGDSSYSVMTSDSTQTSLTNDYGSMFVPEADTGSGGGGDLDSIFSRDSVQLHKAYLQRSVQQAQGSPAFARRIPGGAFAPPLCGRNESNRSILTFASELSTLPSNDTIGMHRRQQPEQHVKEQVSVGSTTTASGSGTSGPLRRQRPRKLNQGRGYQERDDSACDACDSVSVFSKDSVQLRQAQMAADPIFSDDAASHYIESRSFASHDDSASLQTMNTTADNYSMASGSFVDYYKDSVHMRKEQQQQYLRYQQQRREPCTEDDLVADPILDGGSYHTMGGAKSFASHDSVEDELNYQIVGSTPGSGYYMPRTTKPLGASFPEGNTMDGQIDDEDLLYFDYEDFLAEGGVDPASQAARLNMMMDCQSFASLNSATDSVRLRHQKLHTPVDPQQQNLCIREVYQVASVPGGFFGTSVSTFATQASVDVSEITGAYYTHSATVGEDNKTAGDVLYDEIYNIDECSGMEQDFNEIDIIEEEKKNESDEGEC